MYDSDALARFDAVARKELEPYFVSIGDVIYSTNSTLTKNDVIFWGFNPGGDPAIHDPVGLETPVQMPLRDALVAFPDRKESTLDVAWPKNRNGGVEALANDLPYTGRYRSAYCPGEAPYQSRVRYLLRKVGHTDAIVSNFISLQTREPSRASIAKVIPSLRNQTCTVSKKIVDHEIDRMVKACWRVHLEIFAIAKPKVLIIASSDVLDWIGRYRLMEFKEPVAQHIAGHGEWRCKKYLGRAAHEGLTILTVPHMSRWAIKDDDGNQDRQRAVLWVAGQVSMACAHCVPLSAGFDFAKSPVPG